MRTLLLSIAVAAVAATGYVHGVWTNRWQNSPALEQAVGRLERVPLAVGSWRGEVQALPARHAEAAGFAGHLLRRYERPDGGAVTVMLAAGRAGPLSVHTPDVCYGGAGFALAGEAVRHAASDAAAGGAHGRPAEFWKGKFTKPGAV